MSVRSALIASSSSNTKLSVNEASADGSPAGALPVISEAMASLLSLTLAVRPPRFELIVVTELFRVSTWLVIVAI